MTLLHGFLHAGQPHLRLRERQVNNMNAIDTPDGDRVVCSEDDERYRLVSIDAAHAPDGCTGDDWFVYRIAQGTNDITGYRCGSLERVSADVESIVTSLNGRRDWKKLRPTSDRARRAAAAARKASRSVRSD
jgi:hypothetical protein